jgi:subtilisin
MAARQGAHVIVERDQLLNHHGLAPATQAAPGSLPGIFSRGQLDIQVRVLGDQGRPLAKAEVTIYGRNFPAQAQTDQNGSATVSLSGETPDSIRAMYVKPAVDHWERFIDRPRLDVQNVNTITVQPLSTTFSNFPSQQMVGWGQALMGLDKIPANLNGASVKVGIIDSGCDNTHPLLQHIRNGVDITNRMIRAPGRRTGSRTAPTALA